MFTIENLREKKFLREVSRRKTDGGKTYYITGDELSPISLATTPGIRLRVIESSVSTLTELIDQQSGGPERGINQGYERHPEMHRRPDARLRRHGGDVRG